MTTVVEVDVSRPLSMPPQCCACAGFASYATGMLEAKASDWSNKHFISLKFPLCSACGAARTNKGSAKGLFGSKRTPEENAQKKAIDKSVRITHFKPRILAADSATVTFQNDAFGQAFLLVNGTVRLLRSAA